MRSSPSILVRCDGSPEIGLGHVVRCLALADELGESHHCQVAFAMRCSPLGFEMVRRKGYAVLGVSEDREPFDYERWLTKVVHDTNAQALVLDVRDDLPRSALEYLKKKGILIATLDDPSERRLMADMAFYPPVPQVQRMNWAGFTGQLYVGWEWVVLRSEFARRSPSTIRHPPSGIPNILVTMGGSDPAGLTLKAVAALDMLDEDFAVTVLLGPGFSAQDELQSQLDRTRRHFEVRANVTDLPGFMGQSDLAVASFGVTAYELAAMGVPAVYLCLSADHAESASSFAEAGIGVNLGVQSNVNDAQLASSIRTLLVDTQQRQQMDKRAGLLIDGRGAERLARLLSARLTQ